MDTRFSFNNGFGRPILEYGLQMDRKLTEKDWYLGFSVARRVSEHPILYNYFSLNFAPPYEIMRVIEYPINVRVTKRILPGVTVGGGLAINLVEAPDMRYASNPDYDRFGAEDVELSNQQFGLNALVGYEWKNISLRLNYTKGLFWRSGETIASPLDRDKNLDYLLANYDAISLQLGYVFSLGRR